MRAVFTALLLLGLFSAQVATEGGNVTEVRLNGTDFSRYWDGLYGEVVLGAAANYTHTSTGSNITRNILQAQDPGCTHGYSSLMMHIIAVNGTALTAPLSAGDLAQLDAFAGGAEKGSATFSSLSTFTLTYGTIANVPTTYTYANNASSADFRMGYLNDAAGNLVFAAVVVSNRPDWNGTTSDFQIMLPNNGSPAQYTYWVDVNYTCNPAPSPRERHHRLRILPLGPFEADAGETISIPISVENYGDYSESDVQVYFVCLHGFSCGSGTIDDISPGDTESITLPLTVNGPGEYVVRAYAESPNAIAYRDFIVRVLAECREDADCAEDEYCDSGVCEPKKERNETCRDDRECLTGVCAFGICTYCASNAECKADEECVGGECRKINCPCGGIVEHTCVPYECCEDADCAAGFVCLQHKCEVRGLGIILIDGTLIEGDPGLVQVVDNGGAGVGGALLTTNDGQEVVADANGFATILFPYDGLLYADAEGYPRAGKIFDVLKLGLFGIPEYLVAGKEVRIRLVDSRGNGIPFATIIIGEDILATDADGYLTYAFPHEGDFVLRGRKEGYFVRGRGVHVFPAGAAEAFCSFPVFLGWFMFPYYDLFPLWLLSAMLGMINFVMFRKRTLAGYEKALLYAFGPLVLALPAFGPFSICFMSNIVAAQAVGESVLLARKTLAAKEDKMEGLNRGKEKGR